MKQQKAMAAVLGGSNFRILSNFFMSFHPSPPPRSISIFLGVQPLLTGPSKFVYAQRLDLALKLVNGLFGKLEMPQSQQSCVGELK